MTTEANKALVRMWIDAWMRSDVVLLDQIFAPTYTVNGKHIGIEGVKQAVQFLHSVLSDLSAELDDIIAEDDKVVIRWTVRGRQVGDFMGVPATGRPLELTGINMYQVADGRIVANHEQTNVLEIVQRLKGTA